MSVFKISDVENHSHRVGTLPGSSRTGGGGAPWTSVIKL
jgi:hypothetical protein